jgi:6-phosphogluconolactonase
MLEKILLGTYTRRKSEGIYSITLDTEKKDLINLNLETKEVSPTYLAQNKNNQVYSVTTDQEQGGVAAYDKNLNLLNTVTKKGAPICYVAVDEERQLVYGANYHEGEINVYKILDNGALEATDTIVHDEPLGSHENQDKPHAHYADLTPENRLVVCDLGTDRVYTYDVSSKGKLTEVAVYVADDATGPRHLAFHPNGQFAYLFGELASTVTVLAYDQTTGIFTKKQTESTLPGDYNGFNGGAAVRVTSDGRFIYLSNRGHDSIAIFAIEEDGAKISFVEHVSTEGHTPRDFALDPTEKFVVAANLDTDNLTLYWRDIETGKLELLKKNIFAPEAVCVLFEK